MDSRRGTLIRLLLMVVMAGTTRQLCAMDFPSNSVPRTVQALQVRGIENFYRLSERFYSGSAPDGEAGFAELQKRGIKTIISVDGAKPDADTARRFGIRYVHLPIGYDGVPSAQALRLVKAAETLPGPIFVHCHHGLHRGPTGAAIICMAVESWTPDQAESWLHLAGTATNYIGLYRSVEEFRSPTPEVLKTVSEDFPEKSPVTPLADIMIEVDGRIDNLKLIKMAGYKTPPNHPDLDPAQEALLLDELFKELLRSPAVSKRPADFKSKLANAESAAASFRISLAEGRPTEIAFQKVNDACVACHKNYRNLPLASLQK
jgi:protein tyrosine phosphatase (PTP) superfamily phosphohydrolase (DUF442 family)